MNHSSSADDQLSARTKRLLLVGTQATRIAPRLRESERKRCHYFRAQDAM